MENTFEDSQSKKEESKFATFQSKKEFRRANGTKEFVLSLRHENNDSKVVITFQLERDTDLEKNITHDLKHWAGWFGLSSLDVEVVVNTVDYQPYCVQRKTVYTTKTGLNFYEFKSKLME